MSLPPAVSLCLLTTPLLLIYMLLQLLYRSIKLSYVFTGFKGVVPSFPIGLLSLQFATWHKQGNEFCVPSFSSFWLTKSRREKVQSLLRMSFIKLRIEDSKNRTNLQCNAVAFSAFSSTIITLFSKAFEFLFSLMSVRLFLHLFCKLIILTSTMAHLVRRQVSQSSF